MVRMPVYVSNSKFRMKFLEKYGASAEGASQSKLII